MKKGSIVFIIILILLGSCSGIILYKFTNRESKEKVAILAQKDDEKDMNLEVSSIPEETISPNASIIKEIEYGGCEHTKVEKIDVPKDIVNLNETEFRNFYDDWELLNFSSNEIKLYKKELGLCGEHFVIRDDNGYVCIFKLDENGNEVLIEKTQVAVEYLPEIDYQKVKKGINVVGMQELNTILEDFE
ncbi:MAG: BofC C-terminal domain-containing protein [Clostridia bacterium]|nr:BofC C-terminal domain-containing protein [Clostridia bacterium]